MKKFDINEKRVNLRTIDNSNINYVNDLDEIKIDVLNLTTLEQAKSYIPELVMGCWNEDIHNEDVEYSDRDRNNFVLKSLQGLLIPTALKSMTCTFKVHGIHWHFVSHLIRHSGLSFSADCSGDKVIEGRPITIPDFLEDLSKTDGVNYEELYKKSCEGLMTIYDAAINSSEKGNDAVHIQDARLMLPRTMTTFYYVTGNLFDIFRMIRQRLDFLFQPTEDNIFAIKLLIELCKQFPMISLVFDVDNDIHYRYIELLNGKGNFSSKWEKPAPQDYQYMEDKLGMTKEEIDNLAYTYNSCREEMLGKKHFVQLWDELKSEFREIKEKAMEEYKNEYFDCTEGDWK